jgi:hypothetical protein
MWSGGSARDLLQFCSTPDCLRFDPGSRLVESGNRSISCGASLMSNTSKGGDLEMAEQDKPEVLLFLSAFPR